MALMVGGRGVISGVAGSDVGLVDEDVANLSLLMLKILLIGGCIFLLFIEFATFFIQQPEQSCFVLLGSA